VTKYNDEREERGKKHEEGEDRGNTITKERKEQKEIGDRKLNDERERRYKGTKKERR